MMIMVVTVVVEMVMEMKMMMMMMPVGFANLLIKGIFFGNTQTMSYSDKRALTNQTKNKLADSQRLKEIR